jgi:predicted dehydrogenase
MTDRVGLAVIGAGYWGSKLAYEYQLYGRESDEMALRAVIDLNKGSLDRLRAQLGEDGITYSTRLDKILAREDIQAFHIAVPNNAHFDLGMRCLQAGKHALIEKPLCMTSRDAFKLARLAEEKGLVLQAGHIFRFSNALAAAKKALQSGLIGDLYYANLSWSTDMAPPRDRDIIFDLAPHPVDIMSYLLDEWPVEVSVSGRSYVRNMPGSEEVAFVHVFYPKNVLAHVYLSWIQKGLKDRSVILIGSKATMRIEAVTQQVFTYNGKDPETRVAVVQNNTMRDLQRNFVSCIRGRSETRNSALIGALVVHVLEAMQKSLKSQKTEEV